MNNQTMPHTSLNIHNFLSLIKCCDLKTPSLVTINNINVLHIANKTAGLAGDIPMGAAITSILFGDPSNIVIRTIDDTANKDRFPLPLTSLIIDYLVSLPDEALSGTNIDKLCIMLNNRLDYKEYTYYLNKTDIMISSRLYQWLEIQIKNRNEPFSFEYILSAFPHLLGEGAKEKILRLVLILICLDFLKPCSDRVDDRPVTQADKNTGSITDKLDIAELIAADIVKNKSSVTIKCGGQPFTLMIPDIQEQQQAQGFLQSILSYSSWEYIDNNDIRELNTGELAMLKLKLFTYIKLSPVALYENDFSREGYDYRFSLAELSFVKNLPIYRASGMDTLDIAILALLQIKKISLDEISMNISHYTLSEIHRSLFALLVIGLIKVEKERSKTMNNVAAIIRRTLNQKSARSMLHKLINAIKSK